jgi:hypothetical protein
MSEDKRLRLRFVFQLGNDHAKYASAHSIRPVTRFRFRNQPGDEVEISEKAYTPRDR